MIIQGTHRAYMGADTVIAAFVRDDEGGKDLSGAEITATLYALPGEDVMSLPVAGEESGRISFTITAADAKRTLRPGSYSLRVVADGEVIYTAIVEVV